MLPHNVTQNRVVPARKAKENANYIKDDLAGILSQTIDEFYEEVENDDIDEVMDPDHDDVTQIDTSTKIEHND